MLSVICTKVGPNFSVLDGPASHSQITVFLVKKNLPPKITKIVTTLSKNFDLVFRWLFLWTNGIKMEIVGVVGFKSKFLTVYCLSSWIVHQNWKHIELCVSFLNSHCYHYFRDSNIFYPLLGLKPQIMTLCNFFWKHDFFPHCSFAQPFKDAEKLKISQNNLWRSHKDFDR